ncbi:hypothetical protein DFH06DRAFT_153836 [Mycena polygramma]|nr:hypothetical protein DFH06DRAFT_153836 [Mycena polygramma]
MHTLDGYFYLRILLPHPPNRIILSPNRQRKATPPAWPCARDSPCAHCRHVSASASLSISTQSLVRIHRRPSRRKQKRLPARLRGPLLRAAPRSSSRAARCGAEYEDIEGLRLRYLRLLRLRTSSPLHPLVSDPPLPSFERGAIHRRGATRRPAIGAEHEGAYGTSGVGVCDCCGFSASRVFSISAPFLRAPLRSVCWFRLHPLSSSPPPAFSPPFANRASFAVAGQRVQSPQPLVADRGRAGHGQ